MKTTKILYTNKNVVPIKKAFLLGASNEKKIICNYYSDDCDTSKTFSPAACNYCKLRFCLKHSRPEDHECEKKK